MSTPRKSTNHMASASMPRRPCTPESIHGRSPHAPGPPSSPDRRSTSGDKPTKSYLRPTVSSILHHGNTNTHQPRRSIDKPPFLPPSSMGINTQHHKNPSSSSKGSLSLKGILTRATNAMKTNAQRKTTTSAGMNIGKGSGGSTPVRPRSPASLSKKKEGGRNFARSNSVPKKMGVVSKKERDSLSIRSIEDNFTEHLPDPVEIIPHTPQNVVQLTTLQVVPQEPCYTEKIEDNVHEEITVKSIAATDVNLIEENHEDAMVEEVNESSKGVSSVKVIEECREEQPVMEEEVKETPKETESEVIVEKHEEEALEVESADVIEELPQPPQNVSIVEEQEIVRPEETVIELPKEPEEVVAVSVEEENKEEPKESEEREITTAEIIEALKEEVETQDNVEEKLAVEHGTWEETPKEEENGGSVEEAPKVEEKLIATETEETKQEVVVENPKVEEKSVNSIVSEPKKEKATSRKPDAIATRREGAVSNDVIEETKIKLMEKRKNKVLALAGAFETIMQKPEGSTRR